MSEADSGFWGKEHCCLLSPFWRSDFAELLPAAPSPPPAQSCLVWVRASFRQAQSPWAEISRLFPSRRKRGSLFGSGIFSLIRHPLYTGVMLASVGWALIWQSRPALFVALALIPFFAAKARREEYWLREKFPEYAHYERQVNRFIPRIH